MATMDQSAYSIALDNRDVPGVREAIEYANMDSRMRFGSWGGQFKDHFRMMANSSSKSVKDVSTDVLWINFMNLVRDDMAQKEAINLFIGPVVEALALKMDNGDTESLEISDIAQLGSAAVKTARNAGWLSEENRAPVQKLASAAANQWLRMRHQKQAQKTEPGSVPQP